MAVKMLEKQMVNGEVAVAGACPSSDDLTERVLVAHGKAEAIETAQTDLKFSEGA